jgi:hypothetical protein
VIHNEHEALMETWGRLQSADYFYYMAEKNCLHSKDLYSNPYETVQTVFDYYNNIITDFEILLLKKMPERTQLSYHN